MSNRMLTTHLSILNPRQCRGDGATRRAKRKRKRGKRSKGSRNNVEGEYFDLDEQLDDGVGHGEADDGETDGRDRIMDHQLGFYQGNKKKLIGRAIVFMRLFLLNMDAYPAKVTLIKYADKAFTVSCQVAFGVNFKGISYIIMVRETELNEPKIACQRTLME